MTVARGAALIVLAVGAAALGWLGRGWLAATPLGGAAGGDVTSGPCPGGAKPLHWKAPMDPTYVRDQPGKSPMGMDLVPVCPGGEGAPDEDAVRIDPVVVQNVGVRTALVERRDLARKIRAVGRVAYDERRVAHVHTKVQGWIERLHVLYEGQMVDRGQPLLEIYSPELVSTQEELLLAARYREDVAPSPFDDVARSGRELFEATRRRLELWDVPGAEIEQLLRTGRVRKTLTLDAPASGVVVELRVREGMEVSPRMNLYTLADLSQVWVYADVYEYELSWVEVGQRAGVDLSYLPDRSFQGAVQYIYPYLDPKTRTARVRIDLPNPGLLLKPEMFCNVTLEAEERSGVLAVPSEAVIRSGSRNLAIVSLGAGRFQPRQLELGIDSGDGWLEVRSGLAPGDLVVTSSQFLIDSESRLREAVQKLLEPQGAGASQGGGPPSAREGAPAHEGHALPAEAPEE